MNYITPIALTRVPSDRFKADIKNVYNTKLRSLDRSFFACANELSSVQVAVSIKINKPNDIAIDYLEHGTIVTRYIDTATPSILPCETVIMEQWMVLMQSK